MSCYTKVINNNKYYCLDDFFGRHQYGYVLMTEEEKKSKEPWNLLDYSTLETRGGTRKVLNREELISLISKDIG